MATRNGGHTAYPEVKKIKLSISLVKYTKMARKKTSAPPPPILDGGPLNAGLPRVQFMWQCYKDLNNSGLNIN